MADEVWCAPRPGKEHPNKPVLRRSLRPQELSELIPPSTTRFLGSDVVNAVVQHDNACKGRGPHISPSGFLYLQDDVHRLNNNESVPFHWNVDVYLKTQIYIDKSVNISILDMPSRIEPQTVVFKANGFVAIRVDEEEQADFWIA